MWTGSFLLLPAHNFGNRRRLTSSSWKQGTWRSAGVFSFFQIPNLELNVEKYLIQTSWNCGAVGFWQQACCFCSMTLMPLQAFGIFRMFILTLLNVFGYFKIFLEVALNFFLKSRFLGKRFLFSDHLGGSLIWLSVIWGENNSSLQRHAVMINAIKPFLGSGQFKAG